MRPRTLLVLFLLVAGLSAFIWFYERDLPSSEERAELARRVLRLEAGEVERVVIERDGERVVLERGPQAGETAGGETAADGDGAEPAPDAESETWRIAEPLAAPADEWAVDRLVESLTGLEMERALDDADPAALGLEPPRASVLLVGGGEKRRLLFGAPVPASSTMIVALAGRPEAYVVSDASWEDLARPAGEWRRRELFSGRRDDIDRVALEGGAERLLLGRRGAGFWIEAPVEDLADEAHVTSLLTEIVSLRAESFVDDPAATPAELGLEPPAGVVEAVLRGRAAPFRLELGHPTGEPRDRRYGREGDRLFKLDTGLGEALERPVEEWRSRSWSSFEVWSIDSVRLRDAAGELLLERVDGDWRHDGREVAAAPVRELLYALTGVEADGVLSAAAAERRSAALGEPDLEVVLAGADGEETLSLYAGSQGGRAARSSLREVLLLLSEGAVSDLQLKLQEARAAVAAAAAGGDATPEGTAGAEGGES